MNFTKHYLQNIIREFQRYKSLGDRCFEQLNEPDIHWRLSDENNSIAIIVKHMVGNMLSRWTNFLTDDGEKPWRQRDNEFEAPYSAIAEMIKAWESGWECVFNALNTIDDTNFGEKVLIRDEKHTIPEALNRQLAHYAYHTGQIVWISKNVKGTEWKSLTIPKGKSEDYNRSMFGH
ncbi:MAG: DUF1572 family protein [Flavobacteriaceae bacterium]